MATEIWIPFDEISDSQTITQKQSEILEAKSLNIHQNDVLEIIDDHKKRMRILKVQNTKYHVL